MSKKKRTGRAGRVLSAVGTTMIVIVVLLCSLLVLPKVFGCNMYHVLSGSMEPELPVGSLIYVLNGEPEEVAEQEIIAFYGSQEDAGIITHRVMKNNVVSGTFRTKGDANQEEDPLPVPYENYIGRVVWTVPRLGAAMTTMTSLYGKLLAASVVLLGVVLNLAGGLWERASQKKAHRE